MSDPGTENDGEFDEDRFRSGRRWLLTALAAAVLTVFAAFTNRLDIFALVWISSLLTGLSGISRVAEALDVDAGLKLLGIVSLFVPPLNLVGLGYFLALAPKSLHEPGEAAPARNMSEVTEPNSVGRSGRGIGYVVSVWRQPTELSIPEELEDVGKLLGALLSRSDSQRSKFVALAERIAETYPSWANSSWGKEQAKSKWVVDLAVAARNTTGAVFTFRLDPSLDTSLSMAHIVEPAIGLGLCVYDKQAGMAWLGRGSVIGWFSEPHTSAEDRWAASCIKMFPESEVPRSQQAMHEALAPHIDAVLAPFALARAPRGPRPPFRPRILVGGGNVRFIDKPEDDAASPEWRGTTPIGIWYLYLVVHDRSSDKESPRGYDWSFHAELTCPAVEEVARRLIPEWLATDRTTCSFSLADLLDTSETFGRICSPQTMRCVPRAVEELLVPLLARMTTIGALDTFINEATASRIERHGGGGLPTLPHMDEQALSTAFSLKPVIVAALARGPRFQAIAAIKRERQADPAAFDTFMTKLRAEVPELPA